MRSKCKLYRGCPTSACFLSETRNMGRLPRSHPPIMPLMHQNTNAHMPSVIAAATVAVSISSSWFGYNAGDHTAKVGPWRDPLFNAAAQSLHPSSIRFPAGTGAQYWNWSIGCEMPCTSGTSKLEDLKVTLDATNSSVVLVLNMLTDGLASQLRFVQHATDLGIHIAGAELGNEFYNNHPVRVGGVT